MSWEPLDSTAPSYRTSTTPRVATTTPGSATSANLDFSNLNASYLAGVATLGVDEHTAVIFDFAGDQLRVEGRSNGYWRLGGESLTLENGHSYELDDLRNATPSQRADQVDSQLNGRDPLVQLAEVAALKTEEGVAALARLVQLASSAKRGIRRSRAAHRRCSPGSAGPPSSRPLRTGRPAARSTCRQWCRGPGHSFRRCLVADRSELVARTRCAEHPQSSARANTHHSGQKERWPALASGPPLQTAWKLTTS